MFQIGELQSSHESAVKEVLSQLRRKYGPPSSVKTLGAMKMYFWFTKEASVSVGIQSSPEGRSTMVTFRPRS